MDLEPFHRGVYQWVVSVAALVSSVFALEPPPADIPLKSPVALEQAVVEISQSTSFEYIPTYDVLNDVEIPEISANVPDDISIQQSSTLTPEKSILLPAPSALPSQTPAPKPELVPIQPQNPSDSPKPTDSPAPAATVSPAIQTATSQQATPEAEAKKTTSDKPLLKIPSPEPVSNKKSLNPDTLLKMINNHRAGINLPPFEKDAQLCSLAAFRSPQLHEEIFGSKKVHQGLYDLNLPYWITENMASYPSEEQVFKWWMNSKVHRRAIEGDFKYSCGTCSGNSCAQLFTNYTPK